MRLKYRGFWINIEETNSNYYCFVETAAGDKVHVGRMNLDHCDREQVLEDAKTAVDCYLINLKIVTWQKVIEIEREKRSAGCGCV